MKNMKVQSSASETLLDFCAAWFAQRDAVGTLAFFTEDVAFVGTGKDEFAQGLEEMEDYIRTDIKEIPEPFTFTCSIIHEQKISDEICSLSSELSLKNTMYTWHLRGFYTLVLVQGKWRIKSLHYAEPGNSQRQGEHYPWTLVMEQIARQRQELLNDSLPGGMMGGYIEEDFPYYFINRQMLQYLGYEDEEEFVSDIDGKISNCMHPDDRRIVDLAVAKQLKDHGEYVVEYRMKKKDGTYIWVHDLGRPVTAEDGRQAIASVCIDITAQRQAQDEVLHLYNNIPGAVFRCRFDADFSIISANDGLFDFLGYTRAEFEAMGNKMSAVIYPDDLKIMAEKLNAQLQHDNTIHNENRLICKNGKIKWVSIKAQLFTEEDGQRYFYCVFVDITEEKQLQERVRELYEKELIYFAEVSASDGSIQGRLNISTNRVESYIATSDVAVAMVGDTYEKTIENLAASAVDTAYGEEIRRSLDRQKVIEDYAAGKVDYHFDFLRRRNGGGVFWGSTSLRACLNPESGDIVIFFYTFDITEQKLQELLLSQIAHLDYDVITEVDLCSGKHRLISFHEEQKKMILREGDFQQEIRRLSNRYMEEEARRKYLENFDFDFMKKQLAEKPFYSFIVEMIDDEGNVRVKRFQVFYISRELGRVCMTRTDVTDVVRQEQRQKEELAAALVAACLLYTSPSPRD